MAKVTRQVSRLHAQAMDLVRSSKELTHSECLFIFENFNPAVEHDVGANGIFFTPPEIAWQHAVMTQPSGTVVDLCAGIGVLAYQNLVHDSAGYGGKFLSGQIGRMICIEREPLFVEVGKRLIPQAEWYCGDVFDLDLLTSLGNVDCAISNPPFGKTNARNDTWVKTKGDIQWQVIEVAIRLAWGGGVFILPELDCDHQWKSPGYRHQKQWLETDKPRSKQFLGKYFSGVRMPTMCVNLNDVTDDNDEPIAWVEANPSVTLVDINVDDVQWERPFGFEDVLPKPKPTQLSF